MEFSKRRTGRTGYLRAKDGRFVIDLVISFSKPKVLLYFCTVCKF